MALELQVTTLNSTNYGDHGDRIIKAHQFIPGETVEDLVRRVFGMPLPQWRSFDYTDEVVIRVVDGTVESESAPTPPKAEF